MNHGSSKCETRKRREGRENKNRGRFLALHEEKEKRVPYIEPPGVFIEWIEMKSALRESDAQPEK